MSIFSPFSRSAGLQQQQQQQQDHQGKTQYDPSVSTKDAFVSDQAAEAAATHMGFHAAGENPYESVSSGVSDFLDKVNLDSSNLYPMTPLGDGIEYLSLDDNAWGHNGGHLPSRGWGDDLCYGTGTAYLLGLSTGGVWGFLEGIKSPNATSFKLQLNSVLNSMTRRGPFIGNSCGVLAMYFNGINAFIAAQREVHDAYNSIGAAALTGVLFKVTAGPRSAFVSGAICAGVVGTYHLAQMAWAWSKSKDVTLISAAKSSEAPKAAAA
ncbi:Mitochondrial import inner membrane translocase subunit tim23 [Spiromyces aspiralis]|uniref:Mitochondrial import inner membrane translocase subunit tim23 n=1 Tax=Spiromyces aspiralis TaxID=68401 RepID=A0ACC1HLD6_9FUNG|nr:Mitochondrial import inner membrane translocase subunit tim23 [Spiromyces aspiralis]